jgi:hypothetical protein
LRATRLQGDIDKLLETRRATGTPLQIIESPPPFGCPRESAGCCGDRPAFSLEGKGRSARLSLRDRCALGELQELKSQTLDSVYVDDSAVDATIFAELERFTIHKLNVFRGELNKTCAASIRRLRGLTTLEILQTELHEAALADLPATLRTLSITGSSVDHTVVLWPTTLLPLLQLQLKSVRIREGSFDDFAPRDCILKHLQLVNVELPDDWVRLIDHTKHLETLNLTCTTFDNDMLRECLNCRGLKYLIKMNAIATNITDEGASALAAHGSLRDVQLAWTNTTAAGILAAIFRSPKTSWRL